MEKIKYAVNTNSLPDMSYKEIAKMCAKLKVDGIEWGLPDDVEKASSSAKEIAKLTKEEGLEILGFINAGHLWKTELIRKWSDAIAPAGGKMLRITGPWVAWNFDESLHQKDSYSDLMKLTRDGLERLIPLGKEYGIKYVVEMHAGNIMASAPVARKILEGLDNNYVGIIYDPANGIIEGHLRPRNEIEILGSYLAYVHAKNIVWQYNGNSTDRFPQRSCWKIEISPLEYGILDYVEVFFALKLIGFKGWISMEEFFRKSPELKLKRGLSFLKECERTAPTKVLKPYTKFNL